MAILDILFQVQPEKRRKIRNIENLMKRKIKAKLALLFNEQCLILSYKMNNLFPTYPKTYRCLAELGDKYNKYPESE